MMWVPQLLQKNGIMTQRSFDSLQIVALFALLSAAFGWTKASAAPPLGADAAEGVQVLTRGPIHEAFAEPIVFNPQPGVVVAKTPPAAIAEIPPDQRPEGANVAWIPGYWSWDDERSDFLWVSGIWRALPPGRQWMPGYWGASGQGSQWTAGYWADATASEVEYLPQPPTSVEAGPNVAAPSADDSWLPGSWVWQQSRYAWRPGFWATAQPNWVWTPAHYVWAPRGYVFVGGYWDYLVGRRGVLFAPVFFNAAVYSRRGFFYSPTTVIDPGVFVDQLFVRPSYCSYYFGDYYAASYAAAGFYPSFSYQTSRYGYDPIFAHQSWEHRGDPAWGRQVQASFQDRREHQNMRPPRTLADQNAFAARAGNSGKMGFVAATSFNQLASRPNNSLRFQPVNAADRQQFAQRGQEIQKFGADRQRLEAGSPQPQGGTTGKGIAPTRVKLPQSPLANQPVAQLGRDNALPPTHQVLKPALNTEPRPGVEPQPRPNLQPLPKSGTEPQPRPNLDPQPKPRVEPQPRPNLEPQPQPRTEPQPRPNLQPEPQPKPRIEPRPSPVPEPQPKPRTDSQPRPAPVPQPQPKAEPRPAPQPQPQPRAEPHPAPQPQPQPKAEPHPAPAPAPTPAPQPKPAGDPNEKPKK